MMWLYRGDSRGYKKLSNLSKPHPALKGYNLDNTKNLTDCCPYIYIPLLYRKLVLLFLFSICSIRLKEYYLTIWFYLFNHSNISEINEWIYIITNFSALIMQIFGHVCFTDLFLKNSFKHSLLRWFTFRAAISSEILYEWFFDKVTVKINLHHQSLCSAVFGFLT